MSPYEKHKMKVVIIQQGVLLALAMHLMFLNVITFHTAKDIHTIYGMSHESIMLRVDVAVSAVMHTI